MKNNNSTGYRALFDDIKQGSTRLLSQHYANGGKGVRKRKSGQTLLMCAIDANNQEAVGMILKTPAGKWGAKKLKDSSGKTARERAVTASNNEAIKAIDSVIVKMANAEAAKGGCS